LSEIPLHYEEESSRLVQSHHMQFRTSAIAMQSL
jgi:hypothetical protein